MVIEAHSLNVPHFLARGSSDQATGAGGITQLI
jgi:hypothetical protein